MCRAITLRIVLKRYSSSPGPASPGAVTSAGAEAATGARGGRGCGRRLGHGRGEVGHVVHLGCAAPPVAGAPCSMNCCTSFLVTRPPRPVPGIALMSRPCSATMRATTGLTKVRPSPLWPLPSCAVAVGASAWAGRGSGCRSGVAAGDASEVPDPSAAPSPSRSEAPASAPPPPVSITAMRVFTGTVSPSPANSSLHHARGRGGNLGVDLVGRDLDDRLVGLDRLADRLGPAGDRSLGHAHAHLRHDDVDKSSCCHGGQLLGVISMRTASRLRRPRRPPEAGTPSPAVVRTVPGSPAR